MASPGCVWSRALRSRLVQQQFARSVARQAELRPALAVQRSYTTDAKEKRYFSRDRRPEDQRVRRPNRRSNAFESNDSSQRVFSRGFGNRDDADLLMMIAQQNSEDVSRKRIRLEMAWMNDPLVLARRVSQALAGGDPATAVALARESLRQKKGTAYIAAWNRVIQYCMDKGHPKPALRFYNDMKKRGGKPNSRTFTILLSGLRDSPKLPGFNPVKVAESIYDSISAPNSEVKPDIIHTNAMLSVCQYRNDIESLWRIAGKLSEQGSGAPNTTTYTVIMGALQFNAREDIKKMDVKDMDKIFARKSQLINDGKRVWADIVYRWNDGEIVPDNQVTNSMAELLTEGATDQDYYDVFALYHQTMGIPILASQPPESSKGKPSRFWENEQRAKPQQTPREENVPFVDENNQHIKLDGNGYMPEESVSLQSENADMEAEEAEEAEESFETLFDPLPSGPVPDLYPQNKDLTMIIDACLSMGQGLGSGAKYWKYLTMESSSHNIQPDSPSIMHFLRLLRVSRASKMSVRVIGEQMIPSEDVDGKAFHVALSTCRRDNRNHSCLLNGNEIMDLMNKSLLLPDPRALQSYLDLIKQLSTLPNVLMYMKGIEVDAKQKQRSMQALGTNLHAKLHLLALETLRPHIAKLHDAVKQGRPAPAGRWAASQENSVHKPIPGLKVAKLMAHVRLMIDEILKREYSAYVTKAERKILQSDSDMLKEYSDKAVIEKLSKQSVFATKEQRDAYRKEHMDSEPSSGSELNEEKPREKPEEKSETLEEKSEQETEQKPEKKLEEKSEEKLEQASEQKPEEKVEEKPAQKPEAAAAEAKSEA